MECPTIHKNKRVCVCVCGCVRAILHIGGVQSWSWRATILQSLVPAHLPGSFWWSRRPLGTGLDIPALYSACSAIHYIENVIYVNMSAE